MIHTEATDRLHAFETLYAADTTRSAEPDVSDLTTRARRMVEGVLAHLTPIDTVLNDAAIGWTVPRMPVVDRNILRLAAFELMYSDLSPAIVINEAVDLAKEYSTAGSGKFVNGVLDALAKTVRDPSWVEPVMPVPEAAESSDDQDVGPTSEDTVPHVEGESNEPND